MKSPNPPSLSRGRLGITLIELLVVVALIGILAGLLFPVMSRMQKASKTNQCAANLRQIGAAMQLFSNDHNGLIVPGIFKNSFGNTVTWVDALAPYVVQKHDIIAGTGKRPESIFACPEETKNITNGNKSDYGLNIRINASGEASSPGLLRMISIPKPSKTIIVADSFGREIANWSSFRLAPRHDLKANVLFLDMHVELIDPSTIHPMGENKLPWMPVD